MRYFYITYLEPIRTDNVIAPDIAEYDFETYRKLNNFCEVKIQEVKAPNINKALEIAYNAHTDKTNPFIEKPSTNVKDRDITALRESVRDNILKSYDTNTTDDEIINFLKTLNINNPCDEDTVTDTDSFYQNLVDVKNDFLEADNSRIYGSSEGETKYMFSGDSANGKALSQRDIELINNVYYTVFRKLTEENTKEKWKKICEKFKGLFNMTPSAAAAPAAAPAPTLISNPNFDDSVKDLVKSYQSFIEYSINFIQGYISSGSEEKVALTQYLLDFAYDIFIGDNKFTFDTLPDTYVPGIKDDKLTVITSFMIKLKLRYQAMNLENKKKINQNDINNDINNAYKRSGLAGKAVNKGEKRLQFCLKLFNIPEIEVQDWKYGTPSSFIQLAPYFYGSSVATNYSQNMITFSRTQTLTTLSKGDGKCKYGRGWLNQWNREVFENRQKLVNAIRQGADVSENKSKVKGLDVYFIDEGNLDLTKEKFPNIICVMQSTVALCSSDVIAPPVASGQGPTLLKMGQPLYTATNNANPAFLHTKDELLSMWKYYWSGKCNLKYSIPITAMTICGDSSRQPCGIGDPEISEDQLNNELYKDNKVTNVQHAIDKSKSAIENAIKNMPNLTDMDYKYVEYTDPVLLGVAVAVGQAPGLVPGAEATLPANAPFPTPVPAPVGPVVPAVSRADALAALRPEPASRSHDELIARLQDE